MNVLQFGITAAVFLGGIGLIIQYNGLSRMRGFGHPHETSAISTDQALKMDTNPKSMPPTCSATSQNVSEVVLPPDGDPYHSAEEFHVDFNDFSLSTAFECSMSVLVFISFVLKKWSEKKKVQTLTLSDEDTLGLQRSALLEKHHASEELQEYKNCLSLYKRWYEFHDSESSQCDVNRDNYIINLMDKEDFEKNAKIYFSCEDIGNDDVLIAAEAQILNRELNKRKRRMFDLNNKMNFIQNSMLELDEAVSMLMAQELMSPAMTPIEGGDHYNTRNKQNVLLTGLKNELSRLLQEEKNWIIQGEEKTSFDDGDHLSDDEYSDGQT